MTRADIIRQMTDNDLVNLIVWGKFGMFEDVPDCSDDCPDFKAGCAENCPILKREEAVREWIAEDVID